MHFESATRYLTLGKYHTGLWFTGRRDHSQLISFFITIVGLLVILISSYRIISDIVNMKNMNYLVKNSQAADINFDFIDKL